MQTIYFESLHMEFSLLTKALDLSGCTEQVERVKECLYDTFSYPSAELLIFSFDDYLNNSKLKSIIDYYSDSQKILFIKDTSHNFSFLTEVCGVCPVDIDEQGQLCILSSSVERAKSSQKRILLNKRLQLATQTFELLAFTENFNDFLSDMLFLIKSFCHFDGIAVRLKDDMNHLRVVDSYDYEESCLSSFSCLNDVAESRNSCFCGMVLSGISDAEDQNFTKYGTFWTGDLQKSIEKYADSDFKVSGMCIRNHVASMALIPIRFEDYLVGVMHITSTKSDAFNREDIAVFERISTGIAASLKQHEVRLKLAKSERDLKRAQKIAKLASWFNPGVKENTEYYVSDNMYEMFGLKPIEGKIALNELYNITHPDDRQKLMSQREFGRDKLESYSYDFRIIKEGEVKHIHLSAEPVFENKKQLGFAGILQDITLRKKAELELEQNKTFVSKILDGIQAAVIIVDPVKKVIKYANKYAENLLKEDSENIIGHGCMGYLCNNRDKDSCNYHDVVKKNSDFTLTRRNGDKINTMKTVVDVVWDDADHHALIFFDMTDRKKLELQLSHSQKMESIGHLAAGVAHEINTPIQYIGDNVKFLGDVLDDLLKLYKMTIKRCEDAEAKKCLDETCRLLAEMDEYLLARESKDAVAQTLEGVDRVSKIVQAMRTFSHPGVGDKSMIDINKSIDTTITISKNSWKYSCTIETDFIQYLPEIYGYHDDLNQVFLNLIVNAAQAIEEKYKGSGQLGKIYVKTNFDDENVYVSIKDDGVGIAEENLQKIFNPFFTTKPVGKGTGQGLSICHAIVVEKHKGRLEVETKHGVGTEFKITLPIMS